MFRTSVIIFSVCALSAGHEIPGGTLVGTLPQLQPTAYLSLSPSFRTGDGGSYLTGRLSVETTPGHKSGIVVGGGQTGFHFGVESDWEVLRASAFRFFTGISAIYNQDDALGFAAVGISGSIARPFILTRGAVTPFVGIQLSPTFALGRGTSDVGIRPAFGLDVEFSEWGGSHLWVQAGWGLQNARSEAFLGFSYPFTFL